jgi:catechol 2,3-dioxygenase-like lactoylglutathione lyase family enzyme
MAIRITETIYFVHDLDNAIAYYTERIGFTLDVRYEWGFAVLDAPGGKVGLMTESSWDREYPDTDALPLPRIALQTDDFEAETQRLISSGVNLGSIKGVPGARQSVCFFDHDENVFYLWYDPSEPMA